MVEQKTEWVCRACDETECHFSVNVELKTIKPDTCPLSGSGIRVIWVKVA
jgi:hypothetical protein